MARRESSDLEARMDWVERVATFCTDEWGLPPITGRILGWLMICDPREQSAGQIADAIGASRASLTSNMRQLVAAGFVRRRSRPGERTAYYWVEDDAWQKVIQHRFAGMAAFEDIAADGLELVGRTSPQAARMKSAQEAFAWMAGLVAAGPTPPPTKRKKQ
jgi:DNA-binding transcriptional regulator GbsR (MarR family)